MKYFQKLKCEDCGYGTIADDFGEEIICLYCKGSGIIAGADITSTIKPILEGIDSNEHIANINGRKIRSGLIRIEKVKQIIEENTIKVE